MIVPTPDGPVPEALEGTAIILAAAVGFALGALPLTALARRNTLFGRWSPTRRWVIAASTALCFGLLAWRIGIDWLLPALLAFAAAAVVLGVVDIVERRLPNAIVLPAIGVAGALLALATVVTGAWAALLTGLAGGAAMFLLYLMLALLSPRGMGMGDVKLAGLVGLVLGFVGWHAWLTGLALAFLIGGAIALVALMAKRIGARDTIPFGPAMLLGAIGALLLAAPPA